MTTGVSLSQVPVFPKGVASSPEETFLTYFVPMPAIAPRELRVTLELGEEEGGAWAHIPELDISAEGAYPNEAFQGVVSAAREWLNYIREGEVELSPELAGQARYVELLDADVFSWFKDFRWFKDVHNAD